MLKSKIEEILDFIHPEEQILKKGKERQSAIGRNQETDYIPLLLSGTPVEEKQKYCQWYNENYCRYNLEEQFFDKEKMLFEQLFDLLSTARSLSDSQLTVQAKMGAGFLPSILGLKQRIFKEKDPWLKERLTKKEISQLGIKDLEYIDQKGFMPNALEYIDYFKSLIREKASVCVSYTWGPFSLAHLIRGDDIFIDLYDDPNFVHHLMEISTQLYIKGSLIIKRAIGEPPNQGYHGNFYMGSSGVWSNEDTAVLLSPSHLEEFVFPYLIKAYKPFGGAVIHFCGRADYLLDPLLDLSELKGLNLGEPQQQKLSYKDIMQKILYKNKTYYGYWPREEGEDLKSYFKRMLTPLEGEKRGLILNYTLRKEEQEKPERVIELWHSLQN
jgi:hypothetical protein